MSIRPHITLQHVQCLPITQNRWPMLRLLKIFILVFQLDRRWLLYQTIILVLFLLLLPMVLIPLISDENLVSPDHDGVRRRYDWYLHLVERPLYGGFAHWVEIVILAFFEFDKAVIVLGCVIFGSAVLWQPWFSSDSRVLYISLRYRLFLTIILQLAITYGRSLV